MKKVEELNSERLVLKPLTMEHCTEQYVSWLNDPDVYRYLESGGNYTIESLRSYILHIVNSNICMWGIHLKDDGLHIGNIKIDPIDQNEKSGEYGIMMGERSQWGKGFAREASEIVIDHCFSGGPRLNRITLGVLAENRRAVELYRSMGFSNETILRRPGKVENEYREIIRMSIYNQISTIDSSR